MNRIMDVLNGVLLGLAIATAITLLYHRDAWMTITGYWIVTVIRSAVVAKKEAEKDD